MNWEQKKRKKIVYRLTLVDFRTVLYSFEVPSLRFPSYAGKMPVTCAIPLRTIYALKKRGGSSHSEERERGKTIDLSMMETKIKVTNIKTETNKMNGKATFRIFDYF